MLAFAHGLLASPDERCIAALVARELHQLFRAEFAAVYLRGEGGSLTLTASNGRTDLVPAVRPVAERSLAAGRAVRAGSGEDAAAAARGEAGDPSDELQVIALPLMSDQSLGAVALVVTAEALPGVDHGFLAALCDVASSSIENVRLRRRALQQARRDHLTGLGNRRAFHEHLDRLISPPLLASSARDVTLVLFDIDDFKRVNDRFGHGVGDEVLRVVGRALLRASRSSEHAFRLGGDEFALVVHGRGDSGIRAAVRTQEAVLVQRRGISLPNLSAGVASFPNDADSRDDLLEKADAALYAAKRAGKGRVVTFGVLGASQPT